MAKKLKLDDLNERFEGAQPEEAIRLLHEIDAETRTAHGSETREETERRAGDEGEYTQQTQQHRRRAEVWLERDENGELRGQQHRRE